MRRPLLLALLLAAALPALASSSTGARRIMLASTSSLLAQFSLADGNAAFSNVGATCHVSFTGTAIFDGGGCTWTMGGTVPQQGASFTVVGGGYAASAGPFTATNKYTLATGGPVHPAGTFAIKLRFQLDSAAAGILVSQTGVVVGVNADRTVYATVGGVTATSVALAVVNGPNYLAVVREGTNLTVALNADLARTTGGAATTAGSGAVTIGTNGTTGFSGKIVEIGWYLAVPPPPSPSPITVTATTESTYVRPSGEIITVPVGSVASDPTLGILVSPAATNYMVKSEILTSGPWGGVSIGYSADQFDLPGRGVVMDTVLGPSAVSGSVRQSGMTAWNAGESWTASAWTRNVSGDHASLAIGTTSSNSMVGRCGACWRADGAACTAVRLVGNSGVCSGYLSNAPAWPLRIAQTVTAPTALASSVYLHVAPHDYQTAYAGTDSAAFAGVQLEMSSVPTAYVPTGATATARGAQRASVENALVSGAGWCAKAEFQPSDRAWAPDTNTRTLLSAGTNGTANSWDLSVVSGNLIASVYDAGGAARTRTYAIGALTSTTYHTVGICSDPAGGVALYVDGASVGALAGAGTGILASQPTPINIGSRTVTGYELSGWIRNLKLCGNWANCS